MSGYAVVGKYYSLGNFRYLIELAEHNHLTFINRDWPI